MEVDAHLLGEFIFRFPLDLRPVVFSSRNMANDDLEDKVDLVAKEIELTKLLASNDPKIRSDGIKQIKQLLLKHSGDSDEGLIFILFPKQLDMFVLFVFR